MTSKYGRKNEKVIYAVFSTTLFTHAIVSIFFLYYSQWFVLIALAVTTIAHIIFMVAIRKLSFKLLIVFVVYETCAMLALIVVDVWTLVVMELAPSTSFLQKGCIKSEPSNPNSCIRRRAGTLGGVSLAVTIINSAFVWPVLRNYLIFLKESPSSTLTAAMDPQPFANSRGPTDPSTPGNLGPVDNPNFSRYTLPPNAQPNQFPVQPYTIYAPLKDPLALGGLGELPQQFSNPATNPVYPQAVQPSAPPAQFYQQNIALTSRMAEGKDSPPQRVFHPVGNTLYDQVPIPLGGTDQTLQQNYSGSPSPNSSDNTDNELIQNYPRSSNYPSNNAFQRSGHYSTPDNLYPRSANPYYTSEHRAGVYRTGYSSDFEQTTNIPANPRNHRHSRYPSDLDQPYQPSVSKDQRISRYTREDQPPSVLPSDIEPLPDY